PCLSPIFTFFPYTTLFRSLCFILETYSFNVPSIGTPLNVICSVVSVLFCAKLVIVSTKQKSEIRTVFIFYSFIVNVVFSADAQQDRKSTRLNSSHVKSSYA